MNIRAVIFDLDGVICTTDEYHYLAWKKMADSIGVPFDRRVNDRLRGVSRMASLEIVLERYGAAPFSAAEKESLAQQKNEYYKQLLRQLSPADLSPDVRTTLDTLRSRGFLLAIGSSSKNTPFILRQLGLGDYFDAVCDGNDITRSKPDPEVFLKAAGMLCTEPARCMAVDDAVAGAAAGHSAGMAVACVGDAAAKASGDYNLTRLSELLDILK